MVVDLHHGLYIKSRSLPRRGALSLSWLYSVDSFARLLSGQEQHAQQVQFFVGNRLPAGVVDRCEALWTEQRQLLHHLGLLRWRQARGGQDRGGVNRVTGAQVVVEMTEDRTLLYAVQAL